MALLDGDEIVYVAQVPSKHSMRMFTEVGRRVLPHSTGVGKALLANTPPDEVRALLARTGHAGRHREDDHHAGGLPRRARGRAPRGLRGGRQRTGDRRPLPRGPGARTPPRQRRSRSRARRAASRRRRRTRSCRCCRRWRWSCRRLWSMRGLAPEPWAGRGRSGRDLNRRTRLAPWVGPGPEPPGAFNLGASAGSESAVTPCSGSRAVLWSGCGALARVRRPA